MQIDYLIVGQGLAGSLLAWELMQRNYRLLVLDPAEENASQVAAGLINPVTGKRLVKTLNIENLLPSAVKGYQNLSTILGKRFFVELPMLRILHNQEERNYADKRLLQADYRPFLHSWLPCSDGLLTPLGILQQTQTGYLRTRQLLSELRKVFIANASYRQIRVDYQDFVLGQAIQWQDIKARHIVFCEGYQATANPWFSRLPFQLAKGEILTCETVNISPKHIINYGHWLIPLEQGRFKTGATFDNQQIDLLPGKAAVSSLLTALRKVHPQLQQIDINQHQAGIRPATLDKQPFIGTHPYYRNLHIFNGFGSKGSLSIPWHCQQFIASLEQQSPLPSNCDIRRYHDTHFSA